LRDRHALEFRLPRLHSRSIIQEAARLFALLQIRQRRQHFLAVRIRFHLRINLPDHALGIDQERIARRHHPVRRQRTVVADHFFTRVGQELERQAFLGAELLVRIDIIGADAYDGGFLRRVLIQIALEVVGFDGAALRHVFRIKVEDHPLTAELLQADGFALLGLKLEIRRHTALGRDVGGAQDGGGRGETQRERGDDERKGEFHTPFNACGAAIHPSNCIFLNASAIEFLASETKEKTNLHMKRTAEAHWQGDLKGGKGSLTTATHVLNNTAYSFHSRFEDGQGTNPEELLAAAHAGCFTMALSAQLAQAGLTATSLDTVCTISLEKKESGFEVTESHLELKAKIPGATKEAFDTAVHNAETGCPVSKLYKTSITVNAVLE